MPWRNGNKSTRHMVYFFSFQAKKKQLRRWNVSDEILFGFDLINVRVYLFWRCTMCWIQMYKCYLLQNRPKISVIMCSSTHTYIIYFILYFLSHTYTDWRAHSIVSISSGINRLERFVVTARAIQTKTVIKCVKLRENLTLNTR